MSGAALAFAARMLATAGIVLAVTLVVGRVGPRLGGVVAGLPIVVGPGLVFLALDEPPAYVAEAALFTLVSLSATQGFMLAYGSAARRWRPLSAIGAAVAAWALCAAALSGGTPGPWGAFALFVAAALVTRWALGRLRRKPDHAPPAGGGGMLLLRAALAGVLVGAITVASEALGPRLAGLLLAYPVGMTVIAVTIHQRQGAETAIGTLHAAALGTISIAAFGLAVALLAVPLGALTALGPALIAALAVTGALIVAPSLRPGRMTP